MAKNATKDPHVESVNFFKIKKHLDTWMRLFLGKSTLKPRANGMSGVSILKQWFGATGHFRGM